MWGVLAGCGGSYVVDFRGVWVTWGDFTGLGGTLGDFGGPRDWHEFITNLYESAGVRFEFFLAIIGYSYFLTFMGF